MADGEVRQRASLCALGADVFGLIFQVQDLMLGYLSISVDIYLKVLEGYPCSRTVESNPIDVSYRVPYKAYIPSDYLDVGPNGNIHI